jgi:hypothetical protein
MKSLQECIKDACDEVGDPHIMSFYNTYSGRGMYGRQCVGIVGTMNECQLIIGHVIKDLSMALSRVAKESVLPDYSATEDDLADTENDFDKAINQLMNFGQDNMGMAGVILYWPDLEPIQEENLQIEFPDEDDV